MSRQQLDSTNNRMEIAQLALRPINRCILGLLSSCLMMVFVLTGCSSLHIDSSPSVDWSHVQVIELQRPLQDPWELTQPIRSELKTMGFQLTEETNTSPDLILSYFTQEKPDLTAESEVVTRLKSLHIQFIDPATNTLVTAVDYFYPEVTQPLAPEAGVREAFSGLRQQIHKDVTSQTNLPEMVPTQTLPAAPLVVAPPAQSQESAIEQPPSDALPVSNEPAENVTNNNTQSKTVEIVAPGKEAATTVLEKPDKQAQQAVQQTRSPWVPKLQSWGFENWGKDTPADY